MQKIISLFLAILLWGISYAAASGIVISGAGDFSDVKLESAVVSGGAEAKNSEFKTLIVAGSLDFTNLKVTEIFTVSGDAQGTGLECNRLVVNGSFIGKDIVATGDAIVKGNCDVTRAKMEAHAKIFGGFKALRSEFNDLEVNSNEITLSDSVAHDIIMSEHSRPQLIILKGKTIISGDIIFKSGKGEVMADKAVVIKGKIEGGILKKRQ